MINFILFERIIQRSRGMNFERFTAIVFGPQVDRNIDFDMLWENYQIYLYIYK